MFSTVVNCIFQAKCVGPLNLDINGDNIVACCTFSATTEECGLRGDNLPLEIVGDIMLLFL